MYRPGGIEANGNRSDTGLEIGPTQSSLIITQGTESLTVVERFSVFPDNKVLYRFDGQVVRNRLRFRLDTVPSEVTSRWQDNKLVSTIAAMVPGEAEPRRYKLTLSLNEERFLVVRYDDGSSSRTVIYRKRDGTSPPLVSSLELVRSGD
ncbi:MAG: hypothetical protein ABI625_18355 [bacterium]